MCSGTPLDNGVRRSTVDTEHMRRRRVLATVKCRLLAAIAPPSGQELAWASDSLAAKAI